MEVPVLDMNGEQVSQVDLPADIFEAKINTGLMHQAYVRQMANARLGTHKTKTRGEVAYSGAKIYRQKGTGRARHGSRKAPIFVGGGTVFGPRPRKYTKRMPKKMRRAAIRAALSALVRDEQIVVVDKFAFEKPSTKAAAKAIQALVGDKSALVLFVDDQHHVRRSLNNLPRVGTLRANYLNIRDLLRYDRVIIPLDALDVIKQIWGQEVSNG